jgi:hypothetical protein
MGLAQRDIERAKVMGTDLPAEPERPSIYGSRADNRLSEKFDAPWLTASLGERAATPSTGKYRRSTGIKLQC